MSKTYRIIVPLLGVWLFAWIYLSWPAIQDDALIHLRYADNLWLHHFITYDGVHPNYGASSLLYVGLLAVLRGLSVSPNLARATSSVFHVLLFAGLGYGFGVRLPRTAALARFTGVVLLTLVVTPSAVRWLDDGMETGIVVCIASALAWSIHRQLVMVELGVEAKWSGYAALALLGFLAVLLRTELVLVCCVGFVILAAARGEALRGSWAKRLAVSGLRRSHLAVGSLLALGTIVATMHVLLPDTALAKSHGIGHWWHPIHDTAVTLAGAYAFGFGTFIFWLLTLGVVVLRCGRLTMSNALANSLCPVVLTLASLRGQEIQGVRYFEWTFFFAIVWNILEMARPAEDAAGSSAYGRLALLVFVAALVVDLPFESVAMHRVLTRRGEMVRSFEAEGLQALRQRHGIASDIGYIGYFTNADICDLAGLVNGRAAARMGSVERAHACLKAAPDFIFVNASQLIPMMKMTDLSGWKVCGRYDFTNVSSADTHYLIVRPEIISEACLATARLPASIESILAPASRANP